MTLKRSFLLAASFLLLALIGILSNCSNEPKGVDESYKPDHKIAFSHELHAKIDCKYCHNPEVEGKKGIIANTVCINCHKQVNGSHPTDSLQD